MFLNYTLADFGAKLNIVYPKGFTDDEFTNDMDNDLPCNDDECPIWYTAFYMQLGVGLNSKQRQRQNTDEFSGKLHLLTHQYSVSQYLVSQLG